MRLIGKIICPFLNQFCLKTIFAIWDSWIRWLIYSQGRSDRRAPCNIHWEFSGCRRLIITSLLSQCLSYRIRFNFEKESFFLIFFSEILRVRLTNIDKMASHNIGSVLLPHKKLYPAVFVVIKNLINRVYLVIKNLITPYGLQWFGVNTGELGIIRQQWMWRIPHTVVRGKTFLKYYLPSTLSQDCP